MLSLRDRRRGNASQSRRCRRDDESTRLVQLSILRLMKFSLHRSLVYVYVHVAIPCARQNIPTTGPNRRLRVVPGCIATQPAGVLFRYFR